MRRSRAVASWRLTRLALCVAIGAPFVEEIMFRGLLWGALAKRGMSPWWATGLSAAAGETHRCDLPDPAATAQLLTKRFARMITVAAMIGIASSVAGLYVSYTMNLASGAAIVLIETLVFAGALTVVTVRNRMRAVRAGETSSS